MDPLSRHRSGNADYVPDLSVDVTFYALIVESLC